MILRSNVNVATGLYTNWDSFVKLDRKILSWIRNSNKTSPKTIVMNTLEEAAYTLDEALKKGGREFLISKELHDRLRLIFEFKERRLGGNGYNMGRALYELGLNPLVSYPCRPPSIMVNSPDFRVACKDGFKTPKQAIRKDDPEYEHLIIEFNKDPSKGIYASGRYILSWDLMSFHGLFDEEFFQYAANPKYTDVLVFGYAHLLLPSHKEKTDKVVDRLSNGKRPKVHFEFGQGSEESSKYAMEKFSDSQCSDSWGLNEKECYQYLGAKSENLEDLKDAALKDLKKYGLSRICVHAHEAVFSISKYDLEKEMDALRKACRVATALTMGGISKYLALTETLPKSGIKEEKEKIDGSYNFCQVPVYINPNPRILTGLGDAFSAVQATIALS